MDDWKVHINILCVYTIYFLHNSYFQEIDLIVKINKYHFFSVFKFLYEKKDAIK